MPSTYRYRHTNAERRVRGQIRVWKDAYGRPFLGVESCSYRSADEQAKRAESYSLEHGVLPRREPALIVAGEAEDDARAGSGQDPDDGTPLRVAVSVHAHIELRNCAIREREGGVCAVGEKPKAVDGSRGHSADA